VGVDAGRERISEEEDPVVMHLEVVEAPPPNHHGHWDLFFKDGEILAALRLEFGINPFEPGRKRVIDDDKERFLGHRDFNGDNYEATGRDYLQQFAIERLDPLDNGNTLIPGGKRLPRSIGHPGAIAQDAASFFFDAKRQGLFGAGPNLGNLEMGPLDLPAGAAEIRIQKGPAGKGNRASELGPRLFILAVELIQGIKQEQVLLGGEAGGGPLFFYEPTGYRRKRGMLPPGLNERLEDEGGRPGVR
jgi:hypothetical protein